MPKRQYINFGLIELKNKGESVPQCVVCMKTLSNASMKPSLLQRHLQTNHPNKKDRDPNYFKRLEENAKKQQLDKTGKQYQQSVGIVTASYEIALIVSKNKKPHTIAEELIIPAAKVLVKHVISDETVSNLNSVSLSNRRHRRRRLKRYPLQVRHKQDWGRGFILLLPQTAALPGSDAGSDVIKPASSFVIQNRQTSCSMWCPMYRARC